MKKTDLLWTLAYPLYQTIGTIRHEGGHALVAWLQGAEIEEFVFIPRIRGDIFYWGYVRWVGNTNWLATAAPYFLDLLTFAIFFLICCKLPGKTALAVAQSGNPRDDLPTGQLGLHLHKLLLRG